MRGGAGPVLKIEGPRSDAESAPPSLNSRTLRNALKLPVFKFTSFRIRFYRERFKFNSHKRIIHNNMSDDGGDDKYPSYHPSPNNSVYLSEFLPSYDIDTYEPTEPIYDDFEPQSPGEPEANNAATDDPDALEHGQNVVEVGKDASAMGGGAAKTTSRDKKIPKEKRNTTPYMTKYERARVLGTRALQIRWASCM